MQTYDLSLPAIIYYYIHNFCKQVSSEIEQFRENYKFDIKYAWNTLLSFRDKITYIRPYCKIFRNGFLNNYD